MQKSMKKILKFIFIVQSLFLYFSVSTIFGGETPSVPGARVYFINIKDGQTLKSPFLIQFGLTSEMGIAPALADWPDTGHHHLIIDSPVPNENKSISNKHIHMHMGQNGNHIKTYNRKTYNADSTWRLFPYSARSTGDFGSHNCKC
jgi:hypothetical protein